MSGSVTQAGARLGYLGAPVPGKGSWVFFPSLPGPVTGPQVTQGTFACIKRLVTDQVLSACPSRPYWDSYRRLPGEEEIPSVPHEGLSGDVRSFQTLLQPGAKLWRRSGRPEVITGSLLTCGRVRPGPSFLTSVMECVFQPAVALCHGARPTLAGSPVITVPSVRPVLCISQGEGFEWSPCYRRVSRA